MNTAKNTDLTSPPTTSLASVNLIILLQKYARSIPSIFTATTELLIIPNAIASAVNNGNATSIAMNRGTTR